MIVIATNNGYKFLKESLDSLLKLKNDIKISMNFLDNVIYMMDGSG